MGTTTDHDAVTVRMSAIWLWLLRAGGTALGCGAAFATAPLANWLLELTGSAPAPLRIAAQLPTAWAVPVLTLLGAATGTWLASTALRQSPVVTVHRDHIAVHEDGSALHLRRDRTGAVFTDGRDLVVLDHDTDELARVRATDLPTGGLREAFVRFGYPWRGTADPHEAQFTRWVDGTPDLDEAAHTLLRVRHRALVDKKAGAAADALDGLRARGIAVRDRGGGSSIAGVHENRRDRGGLRSRHRPVDVHDLRRRSPGYQDL
ncbi:hypothetical protein ALI22I_23815 [Saccharothrix sp. ALI-22-I]|uniref:YqeB family protein n=1 Tax=Saccharothrix sp. ALI-22-I TaxID=1933778 RepID=UPI00097BC379|nr:hypothetical protein [Saccharothrix sp. ALI-22-I]ONI86663.1 hypothetical protein ALI22I_23815 [Saccharothrix sp. ALI-22-I]